MPAEAGHLQQVVFQNGSVADRAGDAVDDQPDVAGAEGSGEAGEVGGAGTQPHGDEEFLGVVDDLAEQERDGEGAVGIGHGGARPIVWATGAAGEAGEGGSGGHLRGI